MIPLAHFLCVASCVVLIFRFREDIYIIVGFEPRVNAVDGATLSMYQFQPHPIHAPLKLMQRLANF